jgi:hypothetical protein
MSVRLFSLHHVPDDEAADVRELLGRAGVDFYETEAGNWGISPAAIWLRDGAQFERARGLIDGYEQERALRMRAAYQLEKQEGRARTLRDVIAENPLRFVVYATVIGTVAYFSIKPFLDLGN